MAPSDLTSHERLADIQTLVRCRGWTDMVMPWLQERGRRAMLELVANSEPAKDAILKGEIRALRDVVELPSRLEREWLQRVKDDEANLADQERPQEVGHPYGPSPQG